MEIGAGHNRDDDDVVLTTDAITHLRRFLEEVLNRGDAPVHGWASAEWPIRAAADLPL